MSKLINTELTLSDDVIIIDKYLLPIDYGYMIINVDASEDEIYDILSISEITECRMYNICSTSDHTLVREGTIGCCVESYNDYHSNLTLISGGEYCMDTLLELLSKYLSENPCHL